MIFLAPIYNQGSNLVARDAFLTSIGEILLLAEEMDAV